MYSVYALVDPRNEQVRYIGMSKNVWRRYAIHLVMVSRMTPEKDAWVKELRHLDLAPLLKILETAETKDMAYIRETHWIRHYLSLNTSLLNMVKTGKNFPTRQKAIPSSTGMRTDVTFLTVEEVASEAGMTTDTVKRWIRKGELTALRIGGYRIAVEDYEHFKATRRTDKSGETNS